MVRAPNGPTADPEPERLRTLLCAMHDAIQSRLHAARRERSNEDLSAVEGATEADTLYRIDRIGEDAIMGWLEAHWPREWPVEIVMEGTADGLPAPRLPRGAGDAALRFTCIIDPIDGTRSLMHDKRSAWILSALAPHRPDRPACLSETRVAVMTELPVTKQTLADQVSAIRGRGRAGLRSERVDLATGARTAIELRPSTARDLVHGFASFARFFPAGKARLAAFEEALWRRLYGRTGPVIFDDQYLCTGGQFYELLSGHDRMLGDLRPLVFEQLGLASETACHPYDACAALILEEAGCRITAPDGGPLDFPLDTTTPVAWVGFANAALEAHVRPALDAVLDEFFGHP